MLSCTIVYRINELIQRNQRIYHTNDLAILWGIARKNTLYKTISRYIDRGVLFPIYKGLYSTVPLESLDPLALGRAIIHRFTFLTTESVLAQAGAILQNIHVFTFVADQPKFISVGKWNFRYRQLKDEFLYNPAGILDQNGNLVASLERAVADMLYFNPRYHFDVREMIDFERVKSLQQEIGYPC